MSESKEQEINEQTAEEQKQQAAEEVHEQDNGYEGLEAEELRELLVAREQKIEELEKELSETKNMHLRKAAELENYRKRVQRERGQIYETAKANALEDFLDVNDDLRRTLKAAEDLDVNDTFMDGVLMVANKFEEILKKYDVERIDEVGVPFNVDYHDAMMRHKAEDEEVGSDVVLEVVENGYRMGDRTIRHAKVIVSE
ncbi:nucleotide exchange factor GrpE [Fodinibius sediminis]|uniref:Protein GrpE n=1 Tax=Fodinibius sediminis TaxID=1214077 RepID=A0A521BVR1_9BACT|nr:nucleotide exchange factor GrpE [Fodinibius sediminis]SMO50701.1 molecular chaperone GrpE [Fodinibius sediminis]